MVTYRLEHLIIQKNAKFHIITLVDFSQPLLLRSREKQGVNEGVKVVTSFDYTKSPPKASTRVYRKDSKDEDFGSENNLFDQLSPQVYTTVEESIPGHFNAIERAIKNYKRGLYR